MEKQTFITYDDIYRQLRKNFLEAYGNGEEEGLISMKEVKKIMLSVQDEDKKSYMPNSLIEIPEDLYKALEDTYLKKRNTRYVRGYIGCAEIPEEQLDGIMNMALLMYVSNRLAKAEETILNAWYEVREKKYLRMGKKVPKEIDKEIEEKEGSVGERYKCKAISLSTLIASVYVLTKTSEDYENYFSYGRSTDDEQKPTFIIDLPYIGQIGVHYGSAERENWIIEGAQEKVGAILEKKMELGQITKEQFQKITKESNQNGVLPEYEGKFLDIATIPLEWSGKKINKLMKEIKMPVTRESIEQLRGLKLTDREIYYFLIKLGESKELLNAVSGLTKNITPKGVENATLGTTIGEFKGATDGIRSLEQAKDNTRRPKYRIPLP